MKLLRAHFMGKPILAAHFMGRRLLLDEIYPFVNSGIALREEISPMNTNSVLSAETDESIGLSHEAEAITEQSLFAESDNAARLAEDITAYVTADLFAESDETIALNHEAEAMPSESRFAEPEGQIALNHEAEAMPSASVFDEADENMGMEIECEFFVTTTPVFAEANEKIGIAEQIAGETHSSAFAEVDETIGTMSEVEAEAEAPGNQIEAGYYTINSNAGIRWSDSGQIINVPLILKYSVFDSDEGEDVIIEENEDYITFDFGEPTLGFIEACRNEEYNYDTLYGWDHIEEEWFAMVNPDFIPPFQVTQTTACTQEEKEVWDYYFTRTA